jgi:hypothetical protein
MNLKGGALGCWRGHLNIIRRCVQLCLQNVPSIRILTSSSSIVENKLASAFIMEDDADWDIRLLSQLPELAKGVRSISNIPFSEPQYSPYGDNWDIIWPGHCGDILPQNDDRRYIIEHDDTVAPKAHQTWLKGLKEYPEYTRMVHRAGAPMCTFGYAVSYRGAEKILMALAIKAGANWAIDNGLGFLCKNGYLDMKCFSIEPQLFHQ